MNGQILNARFIFGQLPFLWKHTNARFAQLLSVTNTIFGTGQCVNRCVAMPVNFKWLRTIQHQTIVTYN